MTHISGHDRSQILLLPEAVDDYVGPDNPVRFIDAFVDGLDLAAAGFGRVVPKVTGRPAYAPADLLKLYWLRVSGFAGPGDGEGSAGDAGSRCRGDDLVTSWAGRRQFILLRTQ